MSKLLELSTDILDGRLSPDEAGPINRINFQLSSISERVAVVEAFSHCIVFETDDGLLGFDTSSVQGGGPGRLCNSRLAKSTLSHFDLYPWTH